jgi:hypothetical protein
MEYPTFKETSELLDLSRKDKKQMKMWIIKKFVIHLAILFILAFVDALTKEIKRKQKFHIKYKTVIKKNWLGFESYEYHERE